MYIPRHFKLEDDGLVRRLVGENGFGTMITAGEDGVPWASHLPMLLESDGNGDGAGGGRIMGHMARANPHLELIDRDVLSLVIFTGPHGYISPKWYAETGNVPTWNYLAVHAYGRVRRLDDAAATRRHLGQLVASYETGSAPWRIDDLPAGRFDGLAKAIVAFEMPVERIEAKAKLSQNKSAADRAGAIAALNQIPSEEARALAQMMRELTD